jgi:predicted RNase H-like nuclease (RuvC/YqgF family)
MQKRKPGRPKGVKNKKASVFKEAIQNAAHEIKLANSIMSLNNTINHLESDLANLRHQIIGYKAVISYLENQLGLKASQ